MPALPLVENVARVILKFNAGVSSEDAHVVLHYKNDLGWDNSALDDMGDSVNTYVLDELMTESPASLAYKGCTVTDLGVAGAVPRDRSITPVNGSDSVDMNPPSVALVISWHTTNASRNGRGRSYIPGVPRTGMPDLAHAPSSYVGAVLAFAEGLRELPPGADTVSQVIVSYYSKAENPTFPHIRETPVTYPVQLATVNSRIDTQRRRLPRI